jgi:restriction system protein
MTAPTRTRRRAAAKRKRRQRIPAWAWLLGGVGVLWLAVGAVHLGEHHPLAAAAVSASMGIACVSWMKLDLRTIRRLLRRGHRPYGMAEFLAMDDVQFEYALADLCRRDGCTNVVRVGGANDHAADVLATLPDRKWWQFWLPRGRRILIQAKRYGVGNPVRSPALQAVNGTYRDVHRTHLAAVVTTSGFTADAVRFNGLLPQPLRLIDGQALAAWAAGGPPPWK